ncbi:MAG: AmmeMemoRadiSam system protein A [Deltaproteobacteria bacterium]|jgi:AmmeMemoRadiSam system protein A|nr:AmmeMemoRadiSam system protein A [Deltaproteobacteria bacterium]
MPDQSNEKIPPQGGELSAELKGQILDWAREILEKKLNDQPRPKGPDLGDSRGGVFVTLKKNGELRGCIGRFDFSALLSDSIREMTLAAAFQDPRFPPLSLGELGALDITISVLSEPKPLSSLDDLVIGRDGLYLLHPRGRGVLLPSVASEYRWSPLEFAQHTSVKAGLPPDAWKDPKSKLMVFTAPAFSTDPDEKEFA